MLGSLTQHESSSMAVIYTRLDCILALALLTAACPRRGVAQQHDAVGVAVQQQPTYSDGAEMQSESNGNREYEPVMMG